MELSSIIKELIYSKEVETRKNCKVIVSQFANRFTYDLCFHVDGTKSVYGREYIIDDELDGFTIKVECE